MLLFQRIMCMLCSFLWVLCCPLTNIFYSSFCCPSHPDFAVMQHQQLLEPVFPFNFKSLWLFTTPSNKWQKVWFIVKITNCSGMLFFSYMEHCRTWQNKPHNDLLCIAYCDYREEKILQVLSNLFHDYMVVLFWFISIQSSLCSYKETLFSLLWFPLSHKWQEPSMCVEVYQHFSSYAACCYHEMVLSSSFYHLLVIEDFQAQIMAMWVWNW